MPLTELERQPLLDDASRARLQAWREHPRAPKWNTVCGDRLRQEDLREVATFAAECSGGARWQSFTEPPFWARQAARKYLQEVPFYRARGGDADDWHSIPPCERRDLAREPWHFVPDGLGLEEMVVYNTSGTTGSEVWIPTHWRWPSMYLPLYALATALNAVDGHKFYTPPNSPERVPIATIAAQEHTLTFASWSSWLGGAYLKVNLHPSQWRAPADCVDFLNEANPKVICGDPISLSALAATEFRGRPLALISSALALSPSVRSELESRFHCPLVDVYSLSESGPIAASTCSAGSRGAMAILPPDIWVEILRPDGSPCASGEVGEITLTGGRNPFMPLLRYRTGDFARGQVLEGLAGHTPHLLDFHGRALVRFAGGGALGDGEILDIDITHALRNIPLREFALHQNADSSLHFRFRPVAGASAEREIRAALGALFPRLTLTIEEIGVWPEGARKLIRYSSEVGASTCTASPGRTSPSCTILP
jgi:phenylacetate-CoA ligase